MDLASLMRVIKYLIIVSTNSNSTNVLIEYWLGLKYIATITAVGHWELRVDLEDYEGKSYSALYDTFKVNDEDDKFRLTVAGYDSSRSNLEDHFLLYNGVQFSTLDSDNDGQSSNCAARFKGAWWYTTNCLQSNLNGFNHFRDNLPTTSEFFGNGLVWLNWGNVREQGYYFS